MPRKFISYNAEFYFARVRARARAHLEIADQSDFDFASKNDCEKVNMPFY